MGCWGMGIAQSDQYCEIYERFMEEYDDGKPVTDITNDILEDYLGQFSADDGILHDVYFALGKAQWMCGGISVDIMEKVTEIVESNANIKFYRELEASERDLKQRQKNLDKFLAGLQIPRASVRKRKTPESAYIPVPKPKSLPPVRRGDLVAYPVNGKWRVLMVTYVVNNRLAIYAQGFLWNTFFDTIPEWDVLDQSSGLMFGHIEADAFPRDIQIIGHREEYIHALMGDVYERPWIDYLSKPAQPHQFYRPLPKNLCFPYGKAMQKGIDMWVQKTGLPIPKKGK